jgi:hypothetical protein
LEEIATALADQTDYEHQWLINPRSGEIVFWTADTGLDGRTLAELTCSAAGGRLASRRPLRPAAAHARGQPAEPQPGCSRLRP